MAWGKGRAAGRVGSGQTFCQQTRVGSGRVWSKKSDPWQLCVRCIHGGYTGTHNLSRVESLEVTFFQMNKYTNYKQHLNPKFEKHLVNLYTVEISVFGFISDLTDFCKFRKSACFSTSNQKLAL